MILCLIALFPLQFIIAGIGGGAMWSTISALFYAGRYRSSEALWAYGYGIFHFCALAWITPYSLFTVQKTGWLTRELHQKPANNNLRQTRNDNSRVLATVPKYFFHFFPLYLIPTYFLFIRIRNSPSLVQ